jgi:hypothetical protein
MNIVDLLVTIVVVTILVTIVLAIVTYIAYKLRLAREPRREDVMTGPRYFIPYRPASATPDDFEPDGTLRPSAADMARLGSHATEA